MPSRSTTARAAASPETHGIVPGIGIAAFGPEEALPMGSYPRDRCAPPAHAQEGSLHRIAPPAGGPPVEMAWLPDRGVWAPTSEHASRARRLGFTAAYLSSHGWTYSGPATPA